MESTNLLLLSFGRNNRQVLRIVGAVIAFLLTIYSLYSMVTFWDYMSYSYYADFIQVAGSICWFLSCFLQIIGFCALGVILITKPNHLVVPISLVILSLSCLTACGQSFFNLILQLQLYGSSFYVSDYPYIVNIFLSLLTLLAWGVPAVVGFLKNKQTFQNIALLFLILPAVLFLLGMIVLAFGGYITIGGVLSLIGNFLLQCIVGLAVLCNDDSVAAFGTDQSHSKQGKTPSVSRGGNTARPAGSNAAVSADGYNYSISIVAFIALWLFTFGIYPIVWIYKTSRFLNNALGREQFSPGVEVVLYLFIPFYGLYWFYKQAKGIGEVHKLRGDYSYSDLSVTALLLAIFLLAIVAAALMQDQINKLSAGTSYAPGSPNNPNNAYHPNAYQANPGGYIANQGGYTVPQGSLQNNQSQGGYAYQQPQGNLKFSQNTPEENGENISSQLENIKMLKKLLDEGILTQEEFEKKKKDILGI